MDGKINVKVLGNNQHTFRDKHIYLIFLENKTCELA